MPITITLAVSLRGGHPPFPAKPIADYSYEEHFGGVYYLFIRGMQIGSQAGIFRIVPTFPSSRPSINFLAKQNEEEGTGRTKLGTARTRRSDCFLFRTKGIFRRRQDLGRVDRQACAKGGEGASHLTREVSAINPDARSFGPIGDEEAGLPLVLSKDGHLYFRRHFEYERQIARALALRLARPSADPDPAALDFFRQALLLRSTNIGPWPWEPPCERPPSSYGWSGYGQDPHHRDHARRFAPGQTEVACRIGRSDGQGCFPNARVGPSNHGCPRFTDTIRTALVD